jgi:IS30 family transposase
MPKKPNNKKPHLKEEERFYIKKRLDQGESFTNIARDLGRGLTTISGEVNRNGGRERYDPENAQHRAYLKQYGKKKNCNKVAMDGHLYRFVEKGLRMGWSPETISDRLRIQSGLSYVSAKSIRKFIGRRHGLERYLFWHRHRKKSGPKTKDTGFLRDSDRKWIDTRPYMATVAYGHWEMDFIVSTHNTAVLLVLVEKYSRKLLMRLLPNRTNDLVNKAIRDALQGHIVHTVTTDNDIAFSKWKQLEQMLGAQIYFCHPYHSWEKGLVENTNRWIRSCIPKKTNLQLISTDELKGIEDWFNHTPKQCLKGRTAYEVAMQQEYGTLVTSLDIYLPNLRIWG